MLLFSDGHAAGFLFSLPKHPDCAQRSDRRWSSTLSLPRLRASLDGYPRPNGYPEEQREMILRAYQERSSLRGLTRTFGVSRNTVTSWLKKSSCAPALEQHLDASRLRQNSDAGTGRTLVLRGLKE